MKDMKQLSEKIQKKGQELIIMGTRHRFVLIFIILGAARFCAWVKLRIRLLNFLSLVNVAKVEFTNLSVRSIFIP